MNIAVDFDGTIVEHRYPMIGKPRPFAFEALRALQAEGHNLILWTNRDGKHLQEAIDFCKEKGVEFYAVNSEFPNDGWHNPTDARKIIADVYIDDRNIGGLKPWPEMYEMLSSCSTPLWAQRTTASGRSIHHRGSKVRRHKVPAIIQKFIFRVKASRESFKLDV